MSISGSKFYHIPSAIDPSVAQVILEQQRYIQLEQAKILDGETHDVRNTKIGWIDTDHWVSGMMAHFIHQANNNLFHYDLYAWSDKVQYTVYDNSESHYGWHEDLAESKFYPDMNLIRKLSISLCLSQSSDYTGGEFQILVDANRGMHRLKLGCGDAIIFSSDMIHRVKKVTSGKRVSLVGWFAGPAWK